MGEQNYESQWWGYIYDQMMVQDLPEQVEENRKFYRANLEDVSGPILECACGTGLILLPLLASGHDMYGFDISRSMLATLEIKAGSQGLDIADRISVQDFETFHYDRQFDAVTIPTNTFSMLATQEAQIQTLQNIFTHLAPGGKLLLDIRLTGMRELVEAPEMIRGQWYLWTHPETGLPIRQRVDGRFDFDRQLILDHCFIEYEGQTEDFPMTARYIFKDEFQLLLRLAGFKRWEYWGTPERDLLQTGLDGCKSYWAAYKM
jgi:SAM-dependent methyltransferase